MLDQKEKMGRSVLKLDMKQGHITRFVDRYIAFIEFYYTHLLASALTCVTDRR